MKEQKIEYRYAFHNKKVVDIFELQKEASKGEDYICPSCNERLIPVFAEKRTRHFRHAIDVDCSEETYLHRVAKQLFRERFENTESFGIPMSVKITCCNKTKCTVLENKYNCYENNIKRYNLRQRYNEIYIEKEIKGFVADILLKNTEDKYPPLLVEIAVTHECEKEKKESGLRILEIKVENQHDLECIRNGYITKTHFYGFPPLTAESSSPLKKRIHVATFCLYSSGKFHYDLNQVRKCDFNNEVNSNNPLLQFETIQENYRDINLGISDLVLLARRLGFDIKDCYLCKYYHIDTSSCPLHRKFNTPSNPDRQCAYGCKYFRAKPYRYISEHLERVITARPDEFNKIDLSHYYNEKIKQEEIQRKENAASLDTDNGCEAEMQDQKNKERERILNYLKQTIEKVSDLFEKSELRFAFRKKDKIEIINWKNNYVLPEGYTILNPRPYFNHSKLCEEQGYTYLVLVNTRNNDSLYVYSKNNPLRIVHNISKEKIKRFILFPEISVTINSFLRDGNNTVLCDVRDGCFENIDTLLEEDEVKNNIKRSTRGEQINIFGRDEINTYSEPVEIFPSFSTSDNDLHNFSTSDSSRPSTLEVAAHNKNHKEGDFTLNFGYSNGNSDYESYLQQTEQREIHHFYRVSIDDDLRMQEDECDKFELERNCHSLIELSLKSECIDKVKKEEFKRRFYYIIYGVLNVPSCRICMHWGGIECMKGLLERCLESCDTFGLNLSKKVRFNEEYNVWVRGMHREGITVKPDDTRVEQIIQRAVSDLTEVRRGK